MKLFIFIILSLLLIGCASQPAQPVSQPVIQEPVELPPEEPIKETIILDSAQDVFDQIDEALLDIN